MTIDEVTYHWVDNIDALPDQHEGITVEPVTLNEALREDIKARAPVMKLIAQRMADQIRAMYTIDDEMFFARIGIGAANGLYTPTAKELEEMAHFGAFVESVRQWGRSERAKYGL